MLKKQERLTKDKDFDNVFKNGKSSYDKFLGVKVTENTFENSRVGILVSTKVSKKAVDRNKIKRQIREILENYLDGFDRNYDIVVITLPSLLGRDFKQIQNSIIFNLKKLKILK